MKLALLLAPVMALALAGNAAYAAPTHHKMAHKAPHHKVHHVKHHAKHAMKTHHKRHVKHYSAKK